jgi:predicted GNAT family acetyltransferase
VTNLPTGYQLRDGADPIAAHAFLTNSYWAKGITLETVERSFKHSILVSIWHEGKQVAMARVVSDQATYAYVNDVYVLDCHRKLGLAKALMMQLRGDPRLQDLGRWALYTKDAQELYEQFGFRQYPWPERMMIIDPKVFPE